MFPPAIRAQGQSEVDSLCFPETLHKFVIVNAPAAFSMIWNVIKNWIDVRTAAKVEIHSSRNKWEKRLLELVDAHELPSDYGGTATPTTVRLEVENKEAGVIRHFSQTLYVCKYATTETIELKEGEEMETFALTRSLREGVFTMVRTDGGSEKAFSSVTVKHLGKGVDEEDPTRVTFPQAVKGPCTFQLNITCNTGSWSSENFLVAGKVRSLSSLNSIKINVTSSQRNTRSGKENKLPIESFDNDFVVEKLTFCPALKKKPAGSKVTSQTAQSEEKMNGTVRAAEFRTVDPQDESDCLEGWSCSSFSVGQLLGFMKGPF